MAVFSTDTLTEILRLSYQENRSHRYIAEGIGCGKTTIGDFLSKKTYKSFWESYKEKPIAGGEIHTPDDKRKSLSGKNFVFTSAQNNTYVHDGFFNALLNYCDINNAELIIGAYFYNKKGFQNGEHEGDWFDPKIRPYLLSESRNITDSLIWCGELNILPTAVNPLSGLHNYTNMKSGIIPHAKLQLESLPSRKYDDCRMLYTTGTITQRNYVEMKAGQKASHHHSFSALVVEVDDKGDWYVRQLCAERETGSFYDLKNYYTKDGVEYNVDSVEGINWGDIHAAKIDNTVADISWGSRKDSMLSVLKPKYLLLHDVFDMMNRNHHNIKDPYFLYKMHINNTESIKDELCKTVEIMDNMNNRGSHLVVVESNHDLALEKYLKEQDYKKDPINALFFLELQLENYKAIFSGRRIRTFETACHLVKPDLTGVTFLETDESFTLCGNIECGAHGQNGTNGTRGSIQSFQRTGIKYNTGHSHSCAIKDNVFVAGVSGKLDMGYNKGNTTWSNSHIITYKNGKRSIITIKNGKWRK